jgi:bacterioferritin-associated ferredoxin
MDGRGFTVQDRCGRIMWVMSRTRCECKQLSFVALRSYARRHGITELEELIRRTGCCTGCGTCRPHLEEFLRTGELRFGDQTLRVPDLDDRPGLRGVAPGPENNGK